jgi:hypothetical protein
MQSSLLSQILCVRFFPRKEVKNCQRIRGKPDNVLEDKNRDLFCFQDLPLFCIAATFCQEKRAKASEILGDRTGAEETKLNITTPTASLDLDTTPTASLDLDTTPTASLDLDTTPTASLDLDTTPTASLDLDTTPTASLDLDTTLTASLGLDTTPTASLDLDTTPTASLELDTTPTASLDLDTTPTASNIFGVISFRVWTVPPTGNQSPPIDAKIFIIPKQSLLQQQLTEPGSNLKKISGAYCKLNTVN